MKSDDVLIPNDYRSFIERTFGDHGRTWLADLAGVVVRYADQWQLEVGPPFDGLSFNYVAPVRRSDGTQAVLKVGIPEQEQRGEIFALKAFAGNGIVRICESNPDEYVSLIERLSPGIMLSTLFPERDDEATAIAAGIMNDLARPAPADRNEFATVEGWATGGMRKFREAFDGGAGPFPIRLIERAEALFEELLASTDQQWLIHGDLHHMNILSSDAHGGWLAIDPKGAIGDRAFETVAFILNPNTALPKAPDSASIMARRIDMLAERLEIDRQRIHGWALAFSVLSAVWDAETGDWQRTIELSERLASIRP